MSQNLIPLENPASGVKYETRSDLPAVKKVVNHLNFVSSKGKVFDTKARPSLTVPDQTMSPKELLARHKRGILTQGSLIEYFDDEAMGINVRTLDISELDELKKQISQEIADTRMKAQKEADELALKRKSDQDAYFDKLVDAKARQILRKKGEELGDD